MAKTLKAQKQKDTRTVTFDPEKENLSKIITEFHAYKKNAVFYKEYSEMKIYGFFQDIRWMKIMDEKNSDLINKSRERQNKLRSKYENYIEYDKWSDSPTATKAKPLTKLTRGIIISVFVAAIIIMLLVIIGLNKWW